MKTSECANCGDEYVQNKHNHIYCLKTLIKECVICSERFEITCSNQVKRTCGRRCSGVLIRREQKARNKVNCARCGDEFHGAITTAKYCLNTKIKICNVCNNPFEAICTVRNFDQCSESCKFKAIRRDSYVMKEKECVACKNSFTPSSSGHIICNRDHFGTCGFCKESFVLRGQQITDAGRGLYCSNSCSTLGQMGSLVPPEKVASYKEPDKWAVKFFKNTGTKPTRFDFKREFKALPPNHTNFELFKKTPIRSEFEKEISETLFNRMELDYELNKRFTPHELDLYLPTLKLGIEINGEYWHSNRAFERAGNTSKKSKYGTIENYHQAKIDYFKELGIDVVFVWEYDWWEKPDEILNDLEKFIRSGSKSPLLTRISIRMDLKAESKTITNKAIKNDQASLV